MDAVNVEPSPVQGRQVVDVSFLLAHASHVLATRITAAFAELGITPREYCVLAHAMSGQYTQIELATIADLDKTTMLNSMDYLEREGYAERTPIGFMARSLMRCRRTSAMSSPARWARW
jgi:MarR family transcriptional regulator for hemolysin